MLKKPLTLSIVIPAYNEERYLDACLESIAAQSEKPDEVIVVDNNSSDQTAVIARSYGFVTLLNEKKQHQSFAQIKGFNESKGDIIARIDADTILPTSWVANAKNYFDEHPKAVAITGPAEFYDVPLKKIAQLAFHFYHFVLASKFAGHGMLWGANCAFRSSAWPKIQKKMLHRSDIWEDYDLSFNLAPYGTLDYCAQIKAGCSFRSAHKKISQLVDYQLRGIRTFGHHVSSFRLAVFLPCWLTMGVFVPMAVLDHLILRYLHFINSPKFTLRYYIASQTQEDLLEQLKIG